MKREDMVCENCRFAYKLVGSAHEVYCARHAPLFDPQLASRIADYGNYYGIPVYKLFYCGEGEWIEKEMIELKGADYMKIKLYKFGDVYHYETMYLNSTIGE